MCISVTKYFVMQFVQRLNMKFEKYSVVLLIIRFGEYFYGIK